MQKTKEILTPKRNPTADHDPRTDALGRSSSSPREFDPSRRYFLNLVPLAVIAVIAARVGAAARHFLQPQPAKPLIVEGAAGDWKSIGQVAEMNGPEPIMHTFPIEHEAGWAKSTEDRTVYVLPKENHRVVSAVCPHEGCAILWDDETKGFLCPCHDSRFGENGAHLSGPSSGSLTEVGSVIEDGVLKINVRS